MRLLIPVNTTGDTNPIKQAILDVDELVSFTIRRWHDKLVQLQKEDSDVLVLECKFNWMYYVVGVKPSDFAGHLIGECSFSGQACEVEYEDCWLEMFTRAKVTDGYISMFKEGFQFGAWHDSEHLTTDTIWWESHLFKRFT